MLGVQFDQGLTGQGLTGQGLTWQDLTGQGQVGYGQCQTGSHRLGVNQHEVQMTCMCLILSSSTGDKYNKLPELSHMSLFKPICVHCFSGQNSDVGGRLPDVSGASRTSR